MSEGLLVPTLEKALVPVLLEKIERGFGGWRELSRKLKPYFSEEVLSLAGENLASARSLVIPEKMALNFDVLGYGGIRLLRVKEGINASYGGSYQELTAMQVGEEFVVGRKKRELWGLVMTRDARPIFQKLINSSPQGIDYVSGVHLYAKRRDGGDLELVRLGRNQVLLAFCHDENRNNPYHTFKL